MSRGWRFLKDVLWVLVWMAFALFVYRLFAEPAETAAVDAFLFLGVLAAIAIAIISIASPAVNLKAPEQVTSFDSDSGMWMGTFKDTPGRVTFTAVLGIPIAGLIIHAGAFAAPQDTMKVKPPRAKDELRRVLVLNGDRDEDMVEFKHAMHQQLLGNQESCKNCHHIHKPGDRNSNCYACHRSMAGKTSIFDHTYHQEQLGDNDSCKQCHDPAQARTPQSATACAQCHTENMDIPADEQGSFNFMAPPYPNAMHGFCLKCHRQRAREGNRGLDGCGTCHINASFEEQLLD